jgi:hypothetical protein
MNDFSEIENELKKLRPVPPSQRLLTAIENAVSQIAETHPSAPILFRKFTIPFPRFYWGAGLAAAAAVLLVVAWIELKGPGGSAPQVTAVTPAQLARSTPIASPQFVPAGATQVVYQTRDEGLHFRNGATEPVRRVSSRTRETLQWRNPGTGASLLVSYPTEQVELIPVSGQ